MAMRNEDKSTSLIRKTRASLSTLFATALEDGLIGTNPIRGVRIPAPLVEEVPDEDRAKALTRAELATLLSPSPRTGSLLRVPRPYRAADLRDDRPDLGAHGAGDQLSHEGP